MSSTPKRILAKLGSGGDWVSSASMVKELGVSRMAICKQMRRLRDLGYSIESSPRQGYRLTARTARPLPDEVTPLLQTQTLGRAYHYFAEIDSTNSFLRNHIADFPDGATVVANSQSEGRGRFQRNWFSPAGVNVYLSVLLKPAVSPLLAPQLSLVAAAAVLRAVHAAGCRDAAAKWPNDILCHRKKLAGILCEMEAEADLVHGIIIGIGVNANVTDFPPDLRQTATSLRQNIGRPVSMPALTAEILNRLDTEYANWLRSGLADAVGFLNQHSMLSGREVTVTLSREEVRGRVEAITDAGALRVIQANGVTHDVTSGEVCLCRPVAEKKTGPVSHEGSEEGGPRAPSRGHARPRSGRAT